MENLPNCPKCNSEYTYEDGNLFVCPECGHEWSKDGVGEESDVKLFKDSNGNELKDGDTVTVIKDLKVKNIKLIDGDHDIDCKIDGIGAMKLKSEFVKKI